MVCSISTASIKVKQVSPWAHIIKELEERLLGLYLGLCSRVGITGHNFETRYPSNDSDQVWFPLV
jgi:hypothetical protein